MRCFFEFFLIFNLFVPTVLGGYSFDGVDDGASTSTITNIPTTNQDISLYYVAKMNSTTSGKNIFWLSGTSTFSWFSQTAASSKIKVGIPFASGGSAPFCSTTTSNTFAVGDVIRVAASWHNDLGSCAGSTMKINMNGTETTGAAFDFSSNQGATSVHIVEPGTNAVIYEAAVWNTNLSSAELTQLTASNVKRLPYHVKPANLQGYWEANETGDGAAANGAILIERINGNNATADDGANNTGMTGAAEAVLSYP